MRKVYTLIFLLALGPVATVFAQPCPGLAQAPLRTCLRAAFSPARTFGYDRARDSLFRRVDLEAGDSLRDAYTARARFLDVRQDPTTFAYTTAPSFSTEHAWPQSLGAGTGALRSDLHHLFPVQASVNSARGDTPFGEVDDARAAAWYGPDGGLLRSAPPLLVRDRYAERGDGRWEPREDRKGDVARAVLYVTLVYEDTVRARSERLAWFESQLATLLAWHDADPPTAAEVARSARVRAYQGNDDPFVLHPDLARRAFAAPVVSAEPASLAASALTLRVSGSPGPVPTLHVTAPASDSALTVQLFDVLGRPVVTLYTGPPQPRISLRSPDRLARGVYVGRARLGALTATTALVVHS